MIRAPVLLTLLVMAMPLEAAEFTTYKGHGGPVMALDVSPEGQLASASFDNSVGLWGDSGPQWLEGHDAAIVALNFAAAPWLLSGGDDFRVLLWHPGRSEPEVITEHRGKVADIAISPDRTQIASAGWDGLVKLTEVTHMFRSPKNRAALAFPHQVLKGHRSNVTAVAFAPDATLYSASSDGTIRVWKSGDSRVLVKHGFGINKLIVTADWIAYGAIDGGTRVIDHDGKQIADLTLDRRPILSMDYHAETKQLAVGDGQGYIMMVDANDWKITRDFRAMRSGPVWALAFSLDGNVIHTGGIDDVIYAWPVALLDQLDPVGGEPRSFLRDIASMPNGERQFMRKCSICHTLEPGPSRKAGPTLYGVFGRRAGTVPGYTYSPILTDSDIIWEEDTINDLFGIGPDHFIPGSKMPMQVIAAPSDRTDLINYLRNATSKE